MLAGNIVINIKRLAKDAHIEIRTNPLKIVLNILLLFFSNLLKFFLST